MLAIENGKWCLRYTAEQNILMWKHINISKMWGYFNSFERPELPEKEFNFWNTDITPPLSLFSKLKLKIYSFVNLLNKLIFRAFLRKRNIKRIKNTLDYIEDFKDIK